MLHCEHSYRFPTKWIPILSSTIIFLSTFPLAIFRMSRINWFLLFPPFFIACSLVVFCSFFPQNQFDFRIETVLCSSSLSDLFLSFVFHPADRVSLLPVVVSCDRRRRLFVFAQQTRFQAFTRRNKQGKTSDARTKTPVNIRRQLYCVHLRASCLFFEFQF